MFSFISTRSVTRNILNTKSFFIVFFLLAAVTGKTQEAFIGKISNRNNQAITGVSVNILNTELISITDSNGVFKFNKMLPGKYMVEIRALGYAIIDRELILPAKTAVHFQLDETSYKLDEVVVTAQKKEELLQQIPSAITAISAKQVQEYRLWNNKDITAIAPNLYIANPGDQRDASSIRGIATTSYDPTIATYIDGVNQFGLDTYIPILYDVERIEVLRGPQGTLYGRNAMGGVINIITKQPSNTPEGFVEMNFGNYAQQRYLAALRMPLVKDKLYFGASFLYDGRYGYYNNKFNNQTYDQQHSFQGNYYLKYIANTYWSFNFNLKHRANRNNGAFPLVMGLTNAFKDPYTLNQNAITTMLDNSINAALIMNYTGSRFNFNSQTAYQKNYRIYTNPIDGDFSPLDAISIVNNYGKDWNNVKVITQDLRFTSSASSVSKWKWTTGAFLFYQNSPSKQATRYGKNANLLGIGDSLFSTINSTKATKTGFAFYGQASYSLTAQLNITFGMRYDYEHQEQSVLGEYQHDPNPNTIVIRPDTSGKISFSAFSPKVSVDYHLNERSMLYSIYSRGFRTGGLSPLSSDPSQPPLIGFKPEYSNNFELGLKNTLLNNVLIFNIALFYTNVNNVQVPTLVLPDAITVTKNAGKLSSHGIEMEVSANPAKGLLLQYSFGYTDSRFDQLKLSQQGTEIDLADKHQLFTPDITSFLAAQYSYPFCRGHLKAMIRGEWRYLGTTYFDLANTIQQSPYSIFNIRTGITFRKIEFMLWARNITDKAYISYAYDFGAVHLGDPSTLGITISSRF